jgi:hypothetical protein
MPKAPANLCQQAAKNDDSQIFEILSQSAQGVNSCNETGWSPLQVAAMCNSHHAAEALLRLRADVSAKSGYLRPTALHLAAWHGHVEVAEVLINHGADLEATNEAGESPLEKAQQRGKRKFADLMEQHLAKQGKLRSTSAGFLCQECKTRSRNGRLGTGKYEGLWFCDECWKRWRLPNGIDVDDERLPVLTRAEFQKKVREGAQWLIIDGTIIDVAPLTEKGETMHKGGGDVLRRSVGDDLTGYFVYYHANTPRVNSLHKQGLSHMEHVREKCVKHAVGVLDTHAHMPLLTSPFHRFWVESDEKAPYFEHSLTSLSARGLDAKNFCRLSSKVYHRTHRNRERFGQLLVAWLVTRQHSQLIGITSSRIFTATFASAIVLTTQSSCAPASTPTIIFLWVPSLATVTKHWKF